jgi:GNAT superfamily N-acetyltransferase
VQRPDVERVRIEPVDPGSEAAGAILRAYFADVIGRYQGREATADELALAMGDDPSDDLVPPSGLLLAARRGGSVLGCAGVRLLGDGIGEVTRVFVVPAERGRGLGMRLMAELETRARALGVRELRLDTRADLVEAQRLYLRSGYEETAAFNDEPYAERWFRKPLGR